MKKELLSSKKKSGFDLDAYQSVLASKTNPSRTPKKVDGKKIGKTPIKNLQDMSEDEKLAIKQQYLEDKIELKRLT